MSDVALVLAKIFLFVKHWKKLHNCHFFGQKAGYSIIVSQTVFARVHPVMYKSLRARKSNYVKRLCLVVPLVFRPYCPYLVKASRQRYAFPRREGTWHSNPQADRFRPSLYFLP